MGLSAILILFPSLPAVDVAYNGLAARMDMNVFYPNSLFAAAPKLSQSFYLCGVGSQKLHRQITGRI
jgi:hypothetical protein